MRAALKNDAQPLSSRWSPLSGWLPLLLAPVLMASQCTTQELSDSWKIDRLRVLAVRPEPAEPRPGDVVTFESLIISPQADLDMTLWFACLMGDEYGCELDMDVFGSLEGADPADMDTDDMLQLLEQLEAAGLIGAEPYLSPTYTVPDDVLADMTEDERQEGLDLFVQIFAIPEGAESDADMELAFKRVPVSEATTPNHNPDIMDLYINGLPLGHGSVLAVEPGEDYLIEPIPGKTSIETYLYLTTGGEWEERQEEPYFTFYCEDGELSMPFSIYPESSVTWTAPEQASDEALRLWVVVQDRRGGMGWWEQEIIVD